MTAATALDHVRAEHAALYEHTNPIVAAGAPDIDEATLIDAAIASGEAHAVKLVEATRRGFAATDDPVFLAAAERVTRRGLRALMRQDQSPFPSASVNPPRATPIPGSSQLGSQVRPPTVLPPRAAARQPMRWQPS